MICGVIGMKYIVADQNFLFTFRFYRLRKCDSLALILLPIEFFS